MQIVREYRYKTKSSNPSGDFLIWIAEKQLNQELSDLKFKIRIHNGLGKITNALKEFLLINPSIQNLIDFESNIIADGLILSYDQIISVANLINLIPKKLKYRDVEVVIIANWSNSEAKYDLIFELNNTLTPIGREVSQSSKVVVSDSLLTPKISAALNDILTSFKKCYPLQWVSLDPILTKTATKTSDHINDVITKQCAASTNVSLASLEDNSTKEIAVEYSSIIRAIFQKHGFTKSRHSFGMGISGFESFSPNNNRVIVESIYSHLYKSIQFNITWDALGGKGCNTLYLIPYTYKIRVPYPFGNMDQVSAVLSILDERLENILPMIFSIIDENFDQTPKWFFS